MGAWQQAAGIAVRTGCRESTSFTLSVKQREQSGKVRGFGFWKPNRNDTPPKLLLTTRNMHEAGPSIQYRSLRETSSFPTGTVTLTTLEHWEGCVRQVYTSLQGTKLKETPYVRWQKPFTMSKETVYSACRNGTHKTMNILWIWVYRKY